MAKAPDLNEAFRPFRLLAIGAEGAAEVTRAREKHGPNTDLAIGNDPEGDYLNELRMTGVLDPYTFEDTASNRLLERAAQKVNDDACAAGRKHTRLGVILEEAFEALAAASLEELRVELIQTIAMCMDLVADLDDMPES